MDFQAKQKKVKIIYKQYKTALNKLKFPDSWFWARYTINPYSGCYHSCIYCDARSQKYYLEQDFEREIIVKINIDKILEKRIKNSRSLMVDVVGPGGVNDAYQPIEEEIENTRKILKILDKYNFPVNIATKSSLIVRDADLLQDIAKKSWCAVGFSITTVNDELARFLEPFSSTPLERFSAIKELKKMAPNVRVGTYFMPIIPFLEDDDENLESVIRESKKSGADFILFSPGLTLRDYQSEFFLKKLRLNRYEKIAKDILNLFKGRTYPPFEYTRQINLKLLNYCKKFGIKFRLKRWVPRDFRRWNYKVAEYLLNRYYLDSIVNDKPNKNLLWAGLNLNNLDKSIIEVYKHGELMKLKNFDQTIIELVEKYLEKNKNRITDGSLDKFL
ncbi:MAG: radical SAM protein [Promethearchaeota archaeon]